MKKFLLMLLIITMCFAFVSCSSNNVENNSTNAVDSSDITSDINSDDTNLTYKGNAVADIQLEANGYRTKIGTDGADQFLNFEALDEVENVEFSMEVGTIIVVYTTGKEENFGRILVDKNNNFYLRPTDNISKTYRISNLPAIK